MSDALSRLVSPFAGEARRPAAIDDEHAAGYILGIIGSHVERGLRNVFRLSRPAEWDVAEQTLGQSLIRRIVEYLPRAFGQY